jgi:hypothetical protein
MTGQIVCSDRVLLPDILQRQVSQERQYYIIIIIYYNIIIIIIINIHVKATVLFHHAIARNFFLA